MTDAAQKEHIVNDFPMSAIVIAEVRVCLSTSMAIMVFTCHTKETGLLKVSRHSENNIFLFTESIKPGLSPETTLRCC